MPSKPDPPSLPPWDSALGLYLDLSKKNTGFAVMLGFDLVHYGEESFQEFRSDGEMLFELDRWLEGVIEVGEFDLLGVEYAAFQKGRAQELFHAMLGVVKRQAFIANLPIRKIYPGQIKRVVTGWHQAPKSRVVELVNMKYGLDLTSHDVADAIGVGMATGSIEVLGRVSRDWIV